MINGQLSVVVRNVLISLGAVISTTQTNQAPVNTVAVQLPELLLSFAECASVEGESHAVVKRILVFTILNAEIFRPVASAARAVILGFKGTNVVELYTKHRAGDAKVGYVFRHKQNQPWTGSPKFADFEVMREIIDGFTNPMNAAAFDELLAIKIVAQHLQRSEKSAKKSADAPLDAGPASVPASQGGDGVGGARTGDVLEMFPLRPSRFSPVLRLGSDASVNIDTILNWFGIREELVPQLLYVHIGNPLEAFMRWFIINAVEQCV
jgi:hypothetical protein